MARRAGLNAALTSPPHTELASSGPADPDVVETTPLPVFLPMVVPLPQPAAGLSIMEAADPALSARPAELPPGLRPHSHKRRSGGDEAGSNVQPQSIARGLLVTPWFAAAAGFVIAAGMWIISPHADLISASPAIGRATVGPGSTETGKGVGRDQPISPASTSSSGTPHSALASHGRHGKPTPVTVQYHGIAWQNGNFFLVISLPESLNGTHWKLEFQLPGDEDIKVVDARWRSSGPAGGTARDVAPGDRQPVPAGWHPPPGVDFFAYGTGSDTAPTGCTLNGRQCIFVPLQTSQGSGNTSQDQGTGRK